jgi:hypothetical protein
VRLNPWFCEIEIAVWLCCRPDGSYKFYSFGFGVFWSFNATLSENQSRLIA